jgi:hypothetical protein
MLLAKMLVIPLFSSMLLLAHGDNKHTEAKKNISQENIHTDKKLIIYKTINIEYIKDIKPIFKKKCFDCHGNATKFPWYYKIPGIKQMIDYDIKEAKKHIDMSKDFPFISHETPLKDLNSLEEAVLLDDMPPLRYILGHWDSRLSESEKESIIKWSKESILKLKGTRYE